MTDPINQNDPNLYCKGVTRKPVEYVNDQEFHECLAKDFRVLPLFEKKAYDFSRLRHYSLLTNELLSCRWRERLARLGEESANKTRRQFPSTKDFHFYNCCSTYMPSLSIYNKPSHRYSLVPGPGVDKYGSLPIPNELQMRATQKNKN